MRAIRHVGAGLLLLAAVGGCATAPAPGEQPPGTSATSASTPSSPSTPVSPPPEPVASPSAAAPEPSDPGDASADAVTLHPAGADVQAADVALVDGLVRLALGDPEAAAALPVAADGARLGLADRLLVDLPAGAVPDPAAWAIEDDGFRGYVGPFSALELLAGRIEGTDHRPAVPDRGAFDVVVGDHPHCAAGPVAAPSGLEAHRRVSVQPRLGEQSSCLDWFTVDLFVADDGTVAAVTLDLWEP